MLPSVVGTAREIYDLPFGESAYLDFFASRSAVAL